MDGLSDERWKLLSLLIDLFKDTRPDQDDSDKSDPKLHNLVKFILEKIYALDRERLSFIKEALDGAGGKTEADDAEMNSAAKPVQKKSASDIMAKMKKKQAKLAAKMKSKGKAALEK